MYHNARIYAIRFILLCAVLSIFILGCGDEGAGFVPYTAPPATNFLASNQTPTSTASNPTTNPTTTDTNTDPTSTNPITDPTTTLLTLTWDAPKKYTDDSDLAETDIKEYKVYFSTSPITQPTGSYYPIYSDPNSMITPTSVTVNSIIPQKTGTYYFAVTAVDRTDMESDLSNEVSKTL